MKINWQWNNYNKQISLFFGKFKIFFYLKLLRSCTPDDLILRRPDKFERVLDSMIAESLPNKEEK